MPDAPGNNTLRLACPAKLNLTLAVGPPRDDGLHPIASVMAAIDLCDDLRLEAIAQGPSRFERGWADDAPRRQPIDWPIESDLIYRAHALLEREAGRALPIVATLTKRIPAGAGLGGGSSCAAGMLVGLRRLFDLPIDDAQLIELGATLGADVSFAVHALLGRRAARVTGIGEVIEPIDTLPAFDAVLILPDGACPTAAVYRAYDATGRHRSMDQVAELAERWLTIDALPGPLNDLTDAAMAVCPAIGDAVSALHGLGVRPRLTGSGSALFVPVAARAAANRWVQKATQAGLTAVAARYDPVA